MKIPELEFTTALTTMPGKFTTIEGLLDDIINQVVTVNPSYDYTFVPKDVAIKMNLVLYRILNELGSVVQS